MRVAAVAGVKSPPQSPPLAQAVAQDRVVLRGVSWRTYESLLADFPDRPVPRFAFDRGTLEIVVTLSTEHEETNRALSFLVEVLAGAWTIGVRSVGSMTFRRPDQEQGFEPDSAFYLPNAARVRDRKQIDLAVDPPPDLVIEIDVTSWSLDKFPIYARAGVPEVWRHHGGRISMYRLAAGTYREISQSEVLPPLTSELVERHLEQGRSLSRVDWFQVLVDWAKTVAVSDRSQAAKRGRQRSSPA